MDRIRTKLRKTLNTLTASILIAAQFLVPFSFATQTAYALASADLDQYGNEAPEGWQNGNLGDSSSNYREGDSVPFRMKFGDLSTTGSHTVTFNWDTTKDGEHAYDYLTTYDETVATADPCDGVAGCGGTPSTAPIPDDPNASVTQIPGNFTLFNGTITNVSAYTLTGSYAGTSSTSITITFTAATATPVLAWAGHIASELDWGIGGGAGAIEGSPYHMRLISLDGKGGNQDRSLKASAVIQLPNIIVNKYVDTNGDGVSDRTATAGEWSFSLDGATGVATNANGQVAFINVTDGAHQITESGPAEYSFLSGSGTNCTFTTSTATATVASGNPSTDAICNFTNGVNTGSITIIKDAQPNDAQDFSFTTTGTGLSNFTLDDDSDQTLSNTRVFNTLLAGTYSVTEGATSGWDLTSATCTDGSNPASIQLAAGENVTCTFVNVKRGQLIVQKTTLPSGDQTVFGITGSTGNGEFVGGNTGSITDANDHTFTVKPGTYSVSETVPQGWDKTGDTCQNVTVAAGETKTCLITNTKRATINIIKDALPDLSDDFSFVTNTLPGGNFLLDDDNDGTLLNTKSFSVVPDQAYSVSEASLAGWKLTGLTCNTGSFSADVETALLTVTPTPGQTINCTFTNTKLRSISGFKYESSATGGLGSVLGGWTIFIDSNNNGTLDQGELSDVTDQNGYYSFDNLLPGSYTLVEVLQAGWTQIFGPSPVNLTYNADSTNNNFGNFQNGSVSGYKWNDLDGDGGSVAEQGEPKLAGWTIDLYRSSDNTDGNYVKIATTVTDQNGNYSFTNLSPTPSRFYAVCEVQQAGWVQTAPLNNACRYFEMNVSGESNTGRNFGNQGRGTIQVLKNVDTDGDGDVDVTGATDWTWDISGGAQNTATGSSQAVSAGDYTINEDQKDNFHVVSVVCDSVTKTVSETTTVTVAPGANVVCTYTNARDRGTLTVIKTVINDDGGQAVAGDFTVYVKQNGNNVAGSPAAGSASGTNYDLQTGTYVVSEDSPTPLGYTQTSIVCDNQATATVTVTFDDTVVCTITNDDIAPTLQLIKTVINDNSGTSVPADWTLAADSEDDTISMPGNGNAVSALANNVYELSESGPADYHLETDWTCDGGTFDAETNTISLALAQNVTCTIVNDDNQHPDIEVLKTGPATANTGDTVTYTFYVDNTGDTALTMQSVNDSIAGVGTYESGDDNDNEMLDLTETWIYSASYIIPTDQTENVFNVVEVCADDSEGTVVCDEDDHTTVILAKVNVTKYNDFNRNGAFDTGEEAVLPEPTLAGWEFNLIGENSCSEVSLAELALIEIAQTDECIPYNYDESQTTGEDGTTQFANVMPGVSHELNETQQEGWTLSSIECEQDGSGQDGDSYFFSSEAITPGETVNCFVGNYQEPVLLLDKSNNRPDPTVVGDTVTYTLTVAVPQDSGVVFGATVTDLPPEGFDYVSGSWTASSTVRGDLKTGGTTTEPTYGSPGQWIVGTMLPGEIVTLTYQTKIASTASAGTYPDIAFAEGCPTPQFNEDGSCVEEVVLANVSAGEDTPFVDTAVTIKAPQVLGETITVLVNTGSSDIWRNLMVGILLMGAALGTLVKREKKGAQL